METTHSSKKNTGMAIVAYIIFFIPLLTDAKNDPFVKYHVKQGLILFIGYVIEMFVGTIPFFGWIITPLLGVILFILFIIGIMNAINGKEKPLPVIGRFAENFKF
ncbi:MAG: hypothetical protein A2V60_01040 [Candidatus Portnoybacteria bacterium RIFCSPHIGHO2_01_FULL_39_19]|nr:MAG: hypothetical protein A2V60_01040 [Candidatus Portnoybacteria bacterium RIFCSPHIGHO2_01_FULL_39_19]